MNAPIRAAAVTRILLAAGMKKSQEHKSGMVRGYSTFTTGVSSRNLPGATIRVYQEPRGTYADGTPRTVTRRESAPSTEVVVTYTLGQHNRSEAAAEVTARMDEATAILTAKGYTVTREGDGTATRLYVTRPAA